MSLIAFHNLSFNLAGTQILDNVNWQVHSQERIALVGRNGAGKSTLLKLIEGELVPDKGIIQRTNDVRIAGLTQEVPVEENESVYHFLVKNLGEVGEALALFHQASIDNDLQKQSHYQQKIDHFQAWDILPKVDILASRLGVDKNAQMNAISGGMKRRVLLAAALLSEPNLLLLDEPTNHLDVEAIEWLEAYLKSYHGSVLVVTHDRTFLSNIATRIVEIDRGQLYSYECNYETFLERHDERLAAEETQSALFDKRLQVEETWIRTGVKARRTRNEGRVRALKEMRVAHQQRRNELGKVKSLSTETNQSGKLVIEAQDVNYQIDGKPIIKDFSLLLTRGDKLGIIGPNGSGKTTLVRLLLGELQPCSGKITLGTKLEVAYFDQMRRQLDENDTVLNNVADGSDYVTINGKSKHVASYLRDFLFKAEVFNQPVYALSGGERNRLLLAKILAKPANFLVMDEPTNDLDIETLEMLEELLIHYPGTVLLISHDRAFINQVVTSVLVYEGDCHFAEYVGGYDDYHLQQKQKNKAAEKKPAVRSNSARKMSFNEQRELSLLPTQIENLEQEIADLQQQMTGPDFYAQDKQLIQDFNKSLQLKEEQLQSLYQRWELLEERANN